MGSEIGTNNPTFGLLLFHFTIKAANKPSRVPRIKNTPAFSLSQRCLTFRDDCQNLVPCITNCKVAEWFFSQSPPTVTWTTSLLCQVHSPISCCFIRLTAGLVLNFHIYLLLKEQMALLSWLSLVVAEPGCPSGERYSGDIKLRFHDNTYPTPTSKPGVVFYSEGSCSFQ